MKRFFTFVFTVFLLGILTFSVFADDYHPDEGQDYTQPNIWDTLFIPALPEKSFENGFNYVVILRQQSTGDLYLLISDIEFNHIGSPYNSFIDLTSTWGSSGNHCEVWLYDCSESPRKFVYQSKFAMFKERGFEIIYSSFDVIGVSTHNSVYYSSHSDWVSTSVALAKLQSLFFKNINLIVPVGLCIFVLLILPRLVNRIFKPKVRSHIRTKGRFKPKWSRRK